MSINVRYKKGFLICMALLFFLAPGYLIPEPKFIPVKGATSNDWHKDTFWFEPWGSSGVHKGIDIFGAAGTPVIASTHMIILYQGALPKGGYVVIGLGPKWRIHYFAHLNASQETLPFIAKAGSKIGGIGDTGNAKGKPPHLHYSIVSLLPRPLRIDKSTQGYKKAFYINPIEYLTPR